VAKILLSGIPGGGKTTLGDYLAFDHGYEHINMEENNFAPAEEMYASPTVESAFYVGLGDNVVMTWGFNPYRGRDVVRTIVDAGFTPVWLDGDRGHFLSSFMRRERGNGAMELAFYGQMLNIVATRITEELPWVMINPFDENGKFRSIEDNARQLLDTVTTTGD
jgi:hypothetical protein